MLSGTGIQKRRRVKRLVNGRGLKRKRFWSVEVIFWDFCCGPEQNDSTSVIIADDLGKIGNINLPSKILETY
jgi:hypothetical protein